MSGLSGEDRARLDAHTTGAYRPDCPPYYCELCDDCEAALTRALALIDQQEEALRAAAWPLHAMGPGHPDLPDWARKQVGWIQQLQTRADQQEKALEAADELARHYDIDSAPERTLDAYRSARTTEGGRNDG